MPAPDVPLEALVLNGSLKHEDEVSNTEELARLVLSEMQEQSPSTPFWSEIVRLADAKIDVGLRSGRSALLNKIAGVVIIGMPPSDDRAKRLANSSTAHMAKTMARNLVFYAQLLKQHPIVEEPEQAKAGS